MDNNRIVIIGAGMAGLLAANMLRSFQPDVLERKPHLPNAHKAVLRFRDLSVSDVTGIPFKEIQVTKGLIGHGGQFLNEATFWDRNTYSLKATGGLADRSISSLSPSTRYLAPEDFVERMASTVNVFLNEEVDLELLEELKQEGVTIINTAPMPTMMNLFGVKHDDFPYQAITTLRTQLYKPSSFINQTIYNSDPSCRWYRMTVHGGEVMIEFSGKVSMTDDQNLLDIRATEILTNALGDFSRTPLQACNSSVHIQPFGKLLPIDENKRKDFIHWLTTEHNIYSLGRFATWRNLLLSDVVKDVKVICTLASSGSGYDTRKKAKQ